MGSTESSRPQKAAKASWNTSRKDGRRRHFGYGGRMTVACGLTAIMTVLVLVCVLFFVWEDQFQRYTRANIQRVADATAESLAEQYMNAGGWTSGVLDWAESATMSLPDVGIEVFDGSGTPILSSTLTSTSSAASPLVNLQQDKKPVEKKSVEKKESLTKAQEAAAHAHTATTSSDASATGKDAHARFHSTEGKAAAAEAKGAAASATYAEDTAGAAVGSAASSSAADAKKAPPKPAISPAPTSADRVVSAPIVTSSGQTVGTVRVWVRGAETLLTKSDAAFRTNSYRAIWLAATIATVLALFVGAMLSKSLSKPIRLITSTAAQIRNGDLTARAGVKGEDEIGRLGETFDDMATSLERDLKLERRLTSDVAHELRTPLMAMLATVEAMEDGVLPRDNEHLETVSHEVKRLSRLVAAMLKLSRIENGNFPFHPQKTDLANFSQSIVADHAQLFADQGLKLRLNIEGNPRELMAEVDRDMIRQCVVNLLSNAMRYTPAGGWVVLSVSRNKGDILISVEDTGIGIAQEDLTRVFSRFWRSQASRVREKGGLGVGLAVTKELIDRHRGFISLESELGRGTTFTLHIPSEAQSDPQE